MRKRRSRVLSQTYWILHVSGEAQQFCCDETELPIRAENLCLIPVKPRNTQASCRPLSEKAPGLICVNMTQKKIVWNHLVANGLHRLGLVAHTCALKKPGQEDTRSKLNWSTNPDIKKKVYFPWSVNSPPKLDYFVRVSFSKRVNTGDLIDHNVLQNKASRQGS